MIKTSSGGSSGSTYLHNLGLPPQLALMLGNVLLTINFVVALLVPWCEARYKIANIWFPVFVPIKVGLLKCFGDMCSALGGANQQMNEGHGKHKGGGNDSPPPIPGWGPAPMSGGNGGMGGDGGGGGGAKILFQVASVFAVILLSAAVLLALGGALLEFARIQGRHDVSGFLPLQLSAAASTVCLIAVMQYLFITLAGLHGGHYLVGFWLSLGTAVLTGVLALGQYLMNRSYYLDDGDRRLEAGFFIPSHVKQQQQAQQSSRGGGGECARGCCGGGGGGGDGRPPQQVPTNYGSLGTN